MRNLDIDHANHVWSTDIIYIPMARGFVYLVAVMDWFSRRALAWRLSITLEGDFCVDALQEAMDRHGNAITAAATHPTQRAAPRP